MGQVKKRGRRVCVQHLRSGLHGGDSHTGSLAPDPRNYALTNKPCGVPVCLVELSEVNGAEMEQRCKMS